MFSHSLFHFQIGGIAASLIKRGFMIKTTCIDFAHRTEFVTYKVREYTWQIALRTQFIKMANVKDVRVIITWASFMKANLRFIWMLHSNMYTIITLVCAWVREYIHVYV